MSGVVFMGEAPESEEENEDGFVTVSGDQFSDEFINPPETPPSPSPDYPEKLTEGTTSQHQQLSSSPSHPVKSHPQNPEDSPNPPSTSNLYDTLLHRKLREKNELLREELVKIACQPYLNATKEIDSLSQQLIKSQKMVQQVSGTLSKLTRDLQNVEITLDSYRLDSSVIPPFTSKLSHSSPRRQPDKHEETSQDNLQLSSSS